MKLTRNYRLVVIESGLGLESGLESIFAGLGLGLGLELKGLGLGLGLEGSGLGLGYWWTCYKSAVSSLREVLGRAEPRPQMHFGHTNARFYQLGLF